MGSKELLRIDVADFDAADLLHAEHVEQVVRWSSRESMVAIGRDSILRHHMATAAFAHTKGNDPVLAGYGAITQIYSNSVVELGGLVVNPRFRGFGVASHIVSALVERALNEIGPRQILAFSNYDSATLFAKLGGEQVENANESLPPEVWKLCHLCRYYDDAVTAGSMCCGRVFDITNIDTGADSHE